MWDTLLGDIGLRPHEARALSWVEVDCYLTGNQAKWQRSMLGARKVGNHIYNALVDKPLSEQAYWPLALIDSSPLPAKPTGPDTAFLERMAKRLGRPITLITD